MKKLWRAKGKEEKVRKTRGHGDEEERGVGRKRIGEEKNKNIEEEKEGGGRTEKRNSNSNNKIVLYY